MKDLKLIDVVAVVLTEDSQNGQDSIETVGLIYRTADGYRHSHGKKTYRSVAYAYLGLQDHYRAHFYDVFDHDDQEAMLTSWALYTLTL